MKLIFFPLKQKQQFSFIFKDKYKKNKQSFKDVQKKMVRKQPSVKPHKN